MARTDISSHLRDGEVLATSTLNQLFLASILCVREATLKGTLPTGYLLKAVPASRPSESWDPGYGTNVIPSSGI